MGVSVIELSPDKADVQGAECQAEELGSRSLGNQGAIAGFLRKKKDTFWRLILFYLSGEILEKRPARRIL